MHIVDGVGDAAVSGSVHKVGYALVEFIVVVAEYADRHNRQYIASVPVRPVTAYASVVVVGQEAVAGRIEIGQEHALEPGLIGGLPTRVYPQDLRRQRKITEGNAAEPWLVDPMRDLVNFRGPTIQDPDSTVGVACVARDIPADGVEVGGRSVVLRALSANSHVRLWRGSVGVLSFWVCDEAVPAVDPW